MPVQICKQAVEKGQIPLHSHQTYLRSLFMVLLPGLQRFPESCRHVALLCCLSTYNHQPAWKKQSLTTSNTSVAARDVSLQR